METTCHVIEAVRDLGYNGSDLSHKALREIFTHFLH